VPDELETRTFIADGSDNAWGAQKFPIPAQKKESEKESDICRFMALRLRSVPAIGAKDAEHATAGTDPGSAGSRPPGDGLAAAIARRGQAARYLGGEGEASRRRLGSPAGVAMLWRRSWDF